MIQKLKFDSRFKQAFVQVFGKILICESLDSGRKLSKQYQLDAVTLGGDQYSVKGSFTGGSIEWKHSKIDIVRDRNTKKAELHDAQKELARLEARQGDLEHLITSLNSQVNSLEQERHSARSDFDDMKEECKKRTQLMADSKASLANYNSLRERMLKTKEEASRNATELAAELKTPFATKLSSKEQDEMHTLTAKLPEIREKLMELSTDRAGAESKKDETEQILKSNLMKQQEELENALQNIDNDCTDTGSNVEQLKEELEAAKSAVQEIGDQQQEIDGQIQKQQKHQHMHLKQAEKQRATIAECQKFVDSEGKRLSKLISSRQALQDKAAESAKKIAAIGLLPDINAKYSHKSSKELMKLLQKCNEKLKKFSHVNKKALDQHVQFTEQCELLKSRKEELDAGSTAIQQLISQLDDKKNEAILRTFKGVSKHFSKAVSYTHLTLPTKRIV
eukprot:TRINITY_DN30396_c0_g1_i1.p1 TRINITY_DN30396_c0_g1~~TRINITY_DN30396_c0_g1_i1.p1  ORF type:complete len:450 (+),score=163.17 TRINITY_DN30396_c0_g1_i1:208-1557(+)